MIIKGVLKEELANSLELEKEYEKELAKLPKGCLIKKKIKGHEYYYVEVREGEKVRFIYKGKLSKADIKKFNEVKAYREKHKKILSDIKKQIKFLRSILRGKRT